MIFRIGDLGAVKLGYDEVCDKLGAKRYIGLIGRDLR